MKSVKNYIFFDVKLQRKSIAFYQTLNDRNMLHSFYTVKVVQKRLSTPLNIFYVPLSAISSGRRVWVNFSVLWAKWGNLYDSSLSSQVRWSSGYYEYKAHVLKLFNGVLQSATCNIFCTVDQPSEFTGWCVEQVSSVWATYMFLVFHSTPLFCITHI